MPNVILFAETGDDGHMTASRLRAPGIDAHDVELVRTAPPDCGASGSFPASLPP